MRMFNNFIHINENVSNKFNTFIYINEKVIKYFYAHK